MGHCTSHDKVSCLPVAPPLCAASTSRQASGRGSQAIAIRALSTSPQSAACHNHSETYNPLTGSSPGGGGFNDESLGDMNAFAALMGGQYVPDSSNSTSRMIRRPPAAFERGTAVRAASSTPKEEHASCSTNSLAELFAEVREAHAKQVARRAALADRR